jgi:hypothetical protein
VATARLGASPALALELRTMECFCPRGTSSPLRAPKPRGTRPNPSDSPTGQVVAVLEAGLDRIYRWLSSRWCAAAIAVALGREDTPILVKMLDRWRDTVLGLRRVGWRSRRS